MRGGVLKIMTAALVGVASALWVGTARAASDEDEEGMKQRVCNAIGCPGGGQQCAEASGTIGIPGVGELSITFFCYEGGEQET